jgi:hypothetical protein
VLARHPSGQREHVRRFKSETEAKNWIARKSKAWLKKQGYADDELDSARTHFYVAGGRHVAVDMAAMSVTARLPPISSSLALALQGSH